MTFCSLQVLKYSDNLFRWSWILERWQKIQINKNQTKIPTLSDNLFSCSCLSGKTTAGSPRASFGASFFSSPPPPPPLCPIRSLLKRQSCHTIRLMYATILNWPHSDSLLQYFKTVYQVGFQMRTALMAAVFRWTPPILNTNMLKIVKTNSWRSGRDCGLHLVHARSSQLDRWQTSSLLTHKSLSRLALIVVIIMYADDDEDFDKSEYSV